LGLRRLREVHDRLQLRCSARAGRGCRDVIGILMVCPPDPGSVLTETPGRVSVPEGRTENRAPSRGHSGSTPWVRHVHQPGRRYRGQGRPQRSHDTNSPLPPLGDPGLGAFMLSRQPKMPSPTESRSSRFRARRQSRRLANPAILGALDCSSDEGCGSAPGSGQGRVRDLRASMSHGRRAMPSTRS
jgi:hypothetical protein